jgi:predicted ATPase/DNA-binding CsgD family transcriptional regulator
MRSPSVRATIAVGDSRVLFSMARPSRRPGNLPAEVTSFVGRRRELAAIRKKLTEVRLATLVGSGGVGKTRLAVRAATDLRRGFPGGAWWVELAEIREPALVGNAFLAALDLRDQTATEPLALLRSYLRDKGLLLVVDNCEHLLPAAARVLTEILRAAPGVRMIATSREPLSAPGEHVVPVPPLELPPADATVPLARLRHNETVTLFAERAAAASGGFELTDANQAAVVELCHRLDGLPLAIELAAVRTRVLTAQQILDRLTDRFGLLTGGSQAALPRHQTLRTTIDWSHDLLTAGEQTLLRRLWVFAGRFTLEDVEGVCTSDDAPAAQALDVLSSLVDKSLVLKVKEDANDVASYRLHETMREYAGLKVQAADEQDAVELRCADYYRGKCARAPEEARYQLVEWLDWMNLEIDNIRAVLQRCVAHKDGYRGLELVGLIGWYWITRATSEGIRWLDELLPFGGATPQARAIAHFLRGFLAVHQFDPKAAVPPLDQAATAAQEADYVSMHSQSLSMAAVAHGMAGDRAAAKRSLAAAQAVATDLYPPRVLLLQAQALNALLEGDLDTVRSATSEGVRASRETGDLYSLDQLLLNLGLVALMRGDLDKAKPPLTEALRIARQIDDRLAQYCLLDALGCHAAGSGHPRLAAQLLGAAETVQAGIGGSVLPYVAPLVAQAKESARDALGSPAFQAEFETGKRLGRDAAIGLALGEPAQVTATAAADPGASPLRKREAEVAHLVAEGLSNRQIGARLFISEHTVDSHIRSILNKLGVNSRAQIAAWIASAGQQ